MDAKVAELEKSVHNLQQELAMRPRAQHINEEMDKRLKLVEMLLEKTHGRDDNDEFHIKDASFQRPKLWTGSKDKADFVEFSNAMKSWAEVLHTRGVEVMEEYEGSKSPIGPGDVDRIKYPFADKFDRLLYTELVACLSGEPSKFITNQRRGQGIAAWRELVQFYDSRSQVDKSAAYAKISHPQRRAKTLADAVEMINHWESLVNNYETRHEVISDVAKITALKQILPESILIGFRGKMYDKYLTYKQDINNYINDKHAATATKSTGNAPMDLDIMVAKVGDESVEEKAYEDSEEDMLAWTQMGQNCKAKGKGKGKGKNPWDTAPGWGKSGLPHWTAAWNQWESPQMQWQAPWNSNYQQQKGDQEKGKAMKGGAKATKGKGKGKQCYSCKGWGHIAANCPTKVMSLEEMNAATHDHEEGDEDPAWLIMEEPDDEEVFQLVEPKGTKKMKKKQEARKEVEELNVVEEVRGKWVRISAGIDCCAGNTVIPIDMLPEILTKQTDKSGKEFTCANGGKIKNEGEKIIPFITNEGEKKSVRAQRTKVTRMLIAVSSLNNAGYQVSLNRDDPFMKNMANGKVTKLKMKNGIFLMDLWIDTSVTGPVFSRQGS